jgi:hypothetical protein
MSIIFESKFDISAIRVPIHSSKHSSLLSRVAATTHGSGKWAERPSLEPIRIAHVTRMRDARAIARAVISDNRSSNTPSKVGVKQPMNSKDQETKLNQTHQQNKTKPREQSMCIHFRIRPPQRTHNGWKTTTNGSMSTNLHADGEACLSGPFIRSF